MERSRSSTLPPPDPYASSLPSPNGTGFILPHCPLPPANYVHARSIPSEYHTIFISGTSSQGTDGTFAGCVTWLEIIHEMDCAVQTAAVLRKIEAVIRGATSGVCGLESVVDATVYLVDFNRDYAAMNAEWNKVWPDRTKAPTRTCVKVMALEDERMAVEIKCVAVVRGWRNEGLSDGAVGL
jgi:2-aminomuconate deaminase